MVGLIANSKRVYTKGEVQDFPQDCCCQGPRLCGEPRPITPPLETLQQVVLIQSPVGALLLSSGSWCAQDFVCALQDWNLCFTQSSRNPIIKSHWLSRPDSLGIPSVFVGSLVWEARCGVQNLHNSGRTSLVLLFSSLWVTHLAGVGFDFIIIVPLLPPHCSFFFVFGCGYLFLVSSSILLSMVI